MQHPGIGSRTAVHNAPSGRKSTAIETLINDINIDNRERIRDRDVVQGMDIHLGALFGILLEDRFERVDLI